MPLLFGGPVKSRSSFLSLLSEIATDVLTTICQIDISQSLLLHNVSGADEKSTDGTETKMVQMSITGHREI